MKMAKRIRGLLLVTLTGLILSSCASNDWECICEKTVLGVTMQSNYLLTDQTRKEAERICDYIQAQEEWDNCQTNQL